jgi:hypothetical protein
MADFRQPPFCSPLQQKGGYGCRVGICCGTGSRIKCGMTIKKGLLPASGQIFRASLAMTSQGLLSAEVVWAQNMS